MLKMIYFLYKYLHMSNNMSIFAAHLHINLLKMMQIKQQRLTLIN